jgi:hypothetical protein
MYTFELYEECFWCWLGGEISFEGDDGLANLNFFCLVSGKVE